MKLSPREAPGYFARPDPKRAGLLIYGGDAMRVALRRQEVVAALIGPEGEAEMRLTRIAGADLRKDATLLIDAVKAISFFPGNRVALVEDATETVRGAVGAALEDWQPGDAVVIVTAGALGKSSGLRKLFETHVNAYAIGLYDDPPSREEVEALLKQGGLTQVSGDGLAALMALSRALDPGDFRQTVEKLALYKCSDDSPVGPEDVAAVSPATIEAEVDEVIRIVAEGRVAEIGPVMQRITGQGVNPVSLCMAATRHFRTLLAVASDPGGAGIGRLRPPVYGPRRDRLERQAGRWARADLEAALGLLTDTDLTLRSSSKAPQMAMLERALIRLAMLAQRRR
ncbi:DNA polymerase III subunit delta [Frigidibacter sp. ROC022]|uniref:DNA polymerase III subunit delta n=1 Tax=Frigidibacter sp. ROC022 TaxID=2971796 RepID=UPI00215AE42A|nr:DNA polymerase III subunit delta [Frigidibacter sp. ROC022]MCR8724943.1 DNA polymerase III subunit delta [Frigidibacter sp. ROC022]